MNRLQRLISPSLLAALASSNDHYSLSYPKLNDDANVNYKGNRTGEIRAGKTAKRHKGERKLSRKQRKKRK